MTIIPQTRFAIAALLVLANPGLSSAATILLTPAVVQFVVGPVTGNRYVPDGAGQVTVADSDVAGLMALGLTGALASMSKQDQLLSGGANNTSFSIGTLSVGTTTIDCGKNPLQFLTNNGAFTLDAPANDGSCIVLTINGASAGTITFSGFSVGSSTGDTLTTTNTNKFSISIWRINGTSGYRVAAHQ